MPPARTTSLALALLSVLAGCGGDDGGGTSQLYDVSDAPQRYRGVAEAFAREARAAGVPGAVLGVVEGGELVYAVGVGSKSPGGDTRVAPTTLFRIGSVTKMMTALAVMQEVQAGRLGLDDAVPSRVPGFSTLHGGASPDDVSGITVRHLLDQTTGLVDYLEIDAPAGERGDDALEGFLTGRFEDVAYLMSPPGAFYNYSNPNFMLAGLVAQTTSGLPYRQLVAERVFEPLGMSRTFFLADEVLADGDFAVAATEPGDGIPAVVEPGSYDNPWGRPAGYAWSSAADLARFARFLMEGDPAVLSSALHEEMTTPDHDTRELLDLVRYGYGLASGMGFFLDGEFYAVRTLGHDGAIPGFAASVFMVPSLGFGLITLASGDAAYFGDTLVRALRELAPLPAPSTAPDVSPDPSTFAEETGVYEDPNLAGTVTVSLAGGSLRVDIPAATEAGIGYDPVLVPTSPRNFLLTIEGVPFLATFVHGAPGEPAWLRTRLFVAERAPVPGLRPGRAAPPPERFRAALRAAARSR